MPIQPKVFVGSSSEHMNILKRLNILNDSSHVRYVPWTNLGVFQYGEFTLESLTKFLKTVNGAAFFFLGTDRSWWRGQEVSAPRDNVVFEAGMAVSLFGTSRTAIVTDESTKLPSDLSGLTTIRIRLTDDADADASDLHARLERFFAHLSASDQHIRLFWSETNYSIYFHSFNNPEPGEFEEIVNINAVRAVGYLTRYFGHCGISYMLHSSRLQDLMLDANVILLGSSASNKVTRLFTEESTLELPFHCKYDKVTMVGRHIFSKRSDARYFSHFKEGILTKDYGILTKIRNPYRRNSWVVIASGNYGFGTLGAVLITLDDQLLSELPFASDRPCQVILELPVFGPFAVGQPKLLESVELNENQG